MAALVYIYVPPRVFNFGREGVLGELEQARVVVCAPS